MGGPGELAEMFNRSDADISNYIRPQFKKAVDAAKVEKVKDMEQLPPAQRREQLTEGE